MMRWIIGSSLRFRFLVVAAGVALIAVGAVVLRDTPVDVFPEFAQPKVEIHTYTIGLSAESAVNSAPTAFAWPGPPVTMAMPGSPVRRPHASAICTVAASWRTWINSSFDAIAASKIDMMWLPDSVKIGRGPSRSRL